MSVQLYLLTSLSNLHVGAGSSNYGVIDNLVQRDVTDEFPTIFASSMKGAFREYYEEKSDKGPKAKAIFGNEVGNADSQKGAYAFSDAHLLALPVRSNQRPYFMATCSYLLKKFLTITEEDFDHKIPKAIKDEIDLLLTVDVETEKPKLIGQAIPNLKIEDFENVGNTAKDIPILKRKIGSDLVLFHDDDMKSQCSDYALPVLARNNLDNGQSTNLWYEQIIPRQTRFYFLTENVLSTPTSLDLDNARVQIGGNATVGYGRCKIEKL